MTSRQETLRDGELLLPETVSRYRLPANLKPDDSWLFEPDIQRQISEARLIELRDVRISPDGLLFKRGKVLEESFAFDYLFTDWMSRKRRAAKFVAQNYLLKRTRRFADNAVWVSDDWSVGYFHWLADALPRLFLMRDRLNGAVLLLPHNYQRLGFVAPSLSAFGVNEMKYLASDEVLLCRKLTMPTHVAPSGHHNFEVINNVRRILVGVYGDSSQTEPGDRIYISRNAERRRKISNEDEVTNLLQRSGFRIIQTERISFAEQVHLFSKARYLISNHGAGLTNMMFMKPGGSVLELRHELDATNNCYFTLSSAVDLNYYYQTCKPSTAGEDAHTADLLVDTGELETNLKAFLRE